MLASYPRLLNIGFVSLLFTAFPVCSLLAVEPNEVIINEVYFDEFNKDRGTNHFEAVELLVVTDSLDLNGLQVTDRDVWNVPTEFQCILQDAGQDFLRSVPSGTLLVIYNGQGEDDIDAKDFKLSFYAKSSLFCNVVGKTNAFYLGNYGDNVHLLHNENQVDYIKYRPNDKPARGGDAGKLEWEKGFDGFIDVGKMNDSTGFRYMGDKPEMNSYPATWQAYTETYIESNNLGLPNGGRNTKWIEKLRAGSVSINATAEPKK